MPQRRAPKAEPSRYWIFDPWDKTRIKCLKSTINDCYVVRLWEAARSNIHDAELQDATDQINRILETVERQNRDRSRHASLIKFEGRLMLVWTHHDRSVGSGDPVKAVGRALKIKDFGQR